jgi:hypothetical protein
MPAVHERTNIFQNGSFTANEHSPDSKFRTPEKNKTKPFNYGPEKKKMRTYTDEHLCKVKAPLFTATKLSF